MKHLDSLGNSILSAIVAGRGEVFVRLGWGWSRGGEGSLCAKVWKRPSIA